MKRWSQWIRQTHQWVTVLFTVAVTVNFVTVLRGRYNPQLGLLAVIPLALLFLTGAYLFVLPYAARWSSQRREP